MTSPNIPSVEACWYLIGSCYPQPPRSCATHLPTVRYEAWKVSETWTFTQKTCRGNPCAREIHYYSWGFPKMVVPNNQGFPTKKWSCWGVLGVPPFKEAPSSRLYYMWYVMLVLHDILSTKPTLPYFIAQHQKRSNIPVKNQLHEFQGFFSTADGQSLNFWGLNINIYFVASKKSFKPLISWPFGWMRCTPHQNLTTKEIHEVQCFSKIDSFKVFLQKMVFFFVHSHLRLKEKDRVPSFKASSLWLERSWCHVVHQFMPDDRLEVQNK